MRRIYHIFKKESYKRVAEKIIQCLEQSFARDGVYTSAHDADTEHEEGKTYLWTIDDVKNILTPDEYAQFMDGYDISPQGNFEGKNHLVKRKDIFLPAIDEKLLQQRKQRPQPFIDEKIDKRLSDLVPCFWNFSHTNLNILFSKDKTRTGKLSGR